MSYFRKDPSPTCYATTALVYNLRQFTLQPLRDGGRQGGQAQPLPLDVTATDAGERIVAAATESFGQLDVLVNNAGTSKRRSLEQVPDEDSMVPVSARQNRSSGRPPRLRWRAR